MSSARTRLALIVALTGAVVVTAAAYAGTGDRRPKLPDLVQLPPSELSIDADTGRDGETRWKLGFTSAVINDGEGSLVVVGRRPSRRVKTMVADQLVSRPGGRQIRRRRVGRVRYVTSPDHVHWHLLEFERYELRAADGSRLDGRRDRKTGFCLGDRFPGTADARAARYTRNCGLNRPDLLSVRQGISPGFADAYLAHLEGQEIDITGLPAGEYLLVHRVNAGRDLAESDYTNNVACVRIALTYAGGRPAVEPVADEDCR